MSDQAQALEAENKPAENVAEITEATENTKPIEATQETKPEAKEGKQENKEEELKLPERDGDAAAGDDKSTWPKGFADQLKRKNEALARERAEKAALEEKLQQAATVQPHNQQGTVHIPGFEPPRRDDYGSDYEFFQAATDYNNKVETLRRQNEAYQLNESRFRENLQRTVETGSESYSDFNEKTAFMFKQGFPSNRAMCEAIIDSDYKHDIFYFLGTYPQEAEKIARMNPVQAVKKIAELESRFADKRKANVSKTPPPITKDTGGGAAGSGNNSPPNNDSMQDFRNWYESKYGTR